MFGKRGSGNSLNLAGLRGGRCAIRGVMGCGAGVGGVISVTTAMNIACSSCKCLGGIASTHGFRGRSFHAGKLRVTNAVGRRRPVRGSCRLLSCLKHLGLSFVRKHCLLATAFHTSNADGFIGSGH